MAILTLSVILPSLSICNRKYFMYLNIVFSSFPLYRISKKSLFSALALFFIALTIKNFSLSC